MKVKIILGVVIALILVLILSLPAMAVKPTPVLSVGSITYTVDDPSAGKSTVEAGGISWDKVQPRPFVIRVHLYRSSPTPPVWTYSSVLAPKGRAAKYPQDITSSKEVYSNVFDTGDQVQVRVDLVNRKGICIADSDVLTTLNWGTPSTWTAP